MNILDKLINHIPKERKNDYKIYVSKSIYEEFKHLIDLIDNSYFYKGVLLIINK